ncbi:MAG: chromate resistance protein ChrB domain-containing protein [Beijerinckiaceae bacterium]
MTSAPFSMSVRDLAAKLGGPHWPQVIDVCLDDDHAANGRDIPGSVHRAEANFDSWASALDPTRPIVISCQKGFKVSQNLTARLRAKGLPASTLEGGFVAWREAGLPLLDRGALAALGPREGSLWVTRRLPKIDRAACPWLITRFIDPKATFLYVNPDQVEAVAARTGGIPYDIPGVTVTHRAEDCSFDTLLKMAGIADWPPLRTLALIVRGADNARMDLAPQAAGLLAASLGLSHLAGEDDHSMVRHASVIYDGLYAWAAHAAAETHNWPPKA